MRRDEKTGSLLPPSSPEKVEETYRELKRRGVEFTQELMTTSWGNAAMIRDIDGNEFEISWPVVRSSCRSSLGDPACGLSSCGSSRSA